MRFLRHPNIQIIASILWGLGLAALFRKTCHGRGCIIYRAPPPKEVVGKTFRFDGKCYQYTPQTTTCSSQAIPPEEFRCLH